MTAKDLFDSGKIIDTFIHINPDDLNNEYIGHLIQHGNSVYQVITDSNNNLVNPNNDAVMITDDIENLYTVAEENYYDEESYGIANQRPSMYDSMQHQKYQNMFRK